MKKPCLALVTLLILLVDITAHGASAFRAVSGGFNASHVPIWAAYDAGIFKKYGLDVEYLAIDNGSLAMQTLLADEVQILFSTGALAVASNLQGADLAIIAGGINFLPYKLIARPEIGRPSDLKGKPVGISRFGTSSELGMQIALEKLGLTVKQVTVIQAGGNSTRLAALRGGSVSAAIISEPHATMAIKTFGMKSLADLGDLGSPFPLNCFMIKRSYLSANRDKVINFVKAVLEGLLIVKKNKPQALQLVKKYMRLDDEIAQIGNDYYINRYELLSLPDKKGLDFAISLMAQHNPKAKGATPENLRLLEPSILEEINKSGFYEKLSKQY